MRKYVLLVTVTAAVAAQTALAGMEDITWETGLYINSGGDELAKLEFDDGSEDTVHAGGGVHLVFGGRMAVAQDVSILGRIGYLFDNASGEYDTGGDVEIDFSTFTLDALASYRINKHEIGAGISYQPSATYEVDHPIISGSVDADPALGLLIEYRYNLNEKIGFDLRYTSIEYDFEGETRDGSGLGVGAVFMF